MKLITNIFFANILLFMVTSCNTGRNLNSMAYFGGQIVNPKSTKVYFIKNGKNIDSAKLNKDNKFLLKLKNLKPGLYSFKHGNEYQYVFFNTNDSIIIRLNTWDFDESLVFSGRGAERNNFLLNLLLNNENEDKLFLSYYSLAPKPFEAKIDSALKVKNNLYKQYKANTKEKLEFFNELVKSAIKYPLYRKKEYYPFFHNQKLKLNKYPNLDSKFYDFRQNINPNDSSLVYFYPYRNYVASYIFRKAYKEKFDNPNSNLALNKLKYTVKTLKDKQLRNVFLYRFISNSFVNHELTEKQRKLALQIFNENCNNPEMLKEIKQLAFDFDNIKKGTKLFNFKIINVKGHKLNASSVLKNNKTVLYFWSNSVINANNLSKRILYLKKQYPKLNFIGINLDTSKKTWLKSNIFKFLDAKNQYQLTQKCVMRNFITAKTPRIILLNNNAIVKNGFTVFWASNFTKELENLEKN